MAFKKQLVWYQYLPLDGRTVFQMKSLNSQQPRLFHIESWQHDF